MPAHLSVKTRQAGLTSQPTSIYIENLFIAVQSLVVLSLFFKYKEPNYE